LSNAGKSMDPSAHMGVTMATKLPLGILTDLYYPETLNAEFYHSD